LENQLSVWMKAPLEFYILCIANEIQKEDWCVIVYPQNSAYEDVIKDGVVGWKPKKGAPNKIYAHSVKLKDKRNMNDLNVNYTDHKGKYIFCVKSDKWLGIRKGKGYKILEVKENKGDYFYHILTENIDKYPEGVAFKPTSKNFLNVQESMVKLRTLKWERILGGNEEQGYLTD